MELYCNTSFEHNCLFISNPCCHVYVLLFAFVRVFVLCVRPYLRVTMSKKKKGVMGGGGGGMPGMGGMEGGMGVPPSYSLYYSVYLLY